MERRIGDQKGKKAQDFEKKLSATRGNYGDFWNPSALPVQIKLSINDGKSSWQIYKIQISIVAEANWWSEEVKLAESLRWEADNMLQTLSDMTQLYFEIHFCRACTNCELLVHKCQLLNTYIINNLKYEKSNRCICRMISYVIKVYLFCLYIKD